VHLEPLTQAQYDRGGRDSGYGRESPDEYETRYAQGYNAPAGYNAPPMPPPMARNPSPGAMQGRTQGYRADGLRPEYGREDMYGGRRSADASEENMPLQQGRSMV
jgi:hypothetical protein